MIRKIIHINKEKCNGCGACAKACHEGAIGMVNGKAELLRDDYCDGLGDCLPACPTNAISFVEREAEPYNEQAVKAAMLKKRAAHVGKEHKLPCGCPGSNVREIRHTAKEFEHPHKSVPSRLSQWPVQIKLVPVSAPFFDKADLLIAADCTAYAYGDFHNRFIKDRITLIGCPKLDSVDYSDKLSGIFKNNNISSITVVRMEVPCCGGLENAVKAAVKASGKEIPVNIVIIKTDGEII